MTIKKTCQFAGLLLFGIFSFASLSFAQTCGDVCATAKEGGVTEADDGNGSTIECCCLEDTEGSPFVEHPIVDCRP